MGFFFISRYKQVKADWVGNMNWKKSLQLIHSFPTWIKCFQFHWQKILCSNSTNYSLMSIAIHWFVLMLQWSLQLIFEFLLPKIDQCCAQKCDKYKLINFGCGLEINKLCYYVILLSAKSHFIFFLFSI